MSTHRIRLLGPWDFEWHDVPGDLTPPRTRGTVKMPCRWHEVFGSLDGTATFTRNFHSPTNLDPHERIFIVLSEVPGYGTAVLNGEPLGALAAVSGKTEFDVTTQLRKFNRFAITIGFLPSGLPESSDGLLGEVALEIRSE